MNKWLLKYLYDFSEMYACIKCFAVPMYIFVSNFINIFMAVVSDYYVNKISVCFFITKWRTFMGKLRS